MLATAPGHRAPRFDPMTDLDRPACRASLAALGRRFRDDLGSVLGDCREVVLVDYPHHPNVGDSLIWLGEVQALRSLRVRIRHVVASHDYDPAVIRGFLSPATTLLIHGGGNFGSLWPAHQRTRLRAFADFRDHRIVQLPQSIHYHTDDEAAETACAIERHGNVVLMLRDRESHSFAQRHFGPGALLVPDAAFFAPVIATANRGGCIGLLRTDIEQGPARTTGHRWPGDLPVQDWLTPGAPERSLERIAAQIRERLGPWPSISAPLKRAMWNELANERVRRGIRLLSHGSVVVTDRLHAMILALQLGKTVVFVDNSYGKLGAVRSTWFPDCAESIPAESLEAAVSIARARAA